MSNNSAILLNMKHAKNTSLPRIAPSLCPCNVILTLLVFLLLNAYANAQETAVSNTPSPEGAGDPPPTPIPVTKRHGVDKERAKEQRYAEQFADDGYIKLETDGRMFAGLWAPARGEQQYGALLLLHGEGQNPDWPNTLRVIRQTLADFGWSTLSISLPDPQMTVYTKPMMDKPNREKNMTKTMDKPSDTANQNAQSSPMPKQMRQTVDIENLVNQRIDTAFKFLNDKGQFNIIIAGEGLGATRAARYANMLLEKNGEQSSRQMNDANQRPVRALAMIDPQPQIPNVDKALEDFLNAPELPILDAYPKTHYEKSMAAKARKKLAKLNRVKTYIQHGYVFNSANPTQNATALTRRVRGFLTNHARGVEIDKK